MPSGDFKRWGPMVSSANQAGTGVLGLDDVLQGGLSRGHVFLFEGEPGAGKTTVALQFLIEGAKAGENCLYITLSETEAELRGGAASHGWDLGPEISIFELIPPEKLDSTAAESSVFVRSGAG
jgi:circadian clock protein KaiC